MKIELLYFEGCPSWQSALANLNSALNLESLASPVALVQIEDDPAATRRKFLGSPSVHVNGEDLWPQPAREYYMSCRMYRTPEGVRGWPTVEMLRERLQALAKES